MQIVRNLESEDWFPDLIDMLMEDDESGDAEYYYNDETDSYEIIMPKHIRVDQLSGVFYEIVSKMEFWETLHSTIPPTTVFKNELENFDIRSYFGLTTRRKRQEPSPEDNSNSETTEETTTEEVTTEEITTEEVTTEISTTTQDPVIEAREFYNETLVNMRRLTAALRVIFDGGSTSRKKRAINYDDWTDDDYERCGVMWDLPSDLGGLRDGAPLSLAKISVAQLVSVESIVFLENNLTSTHIVFCDLVDREIQTIEDGIKRLEEFVAIKQYDDDLNDRLDKSCLIPEQPDLKSCACECHKKDKMAIYDLYTSLHMIDNFNFQRGGDMYAWYYGDQFERFPYDTDNSPFVNTNISKEILDFEKAVLMDLR